ncbi:DUF6443 domain-containing protein [Flavobacterium sp.]|uniref:DUF6443 domain-containing protein n=1 Tax=Flavobacterium sp. TaxID=239 RepID=UPI00120AFAB1|nr:DUF6443 domain-containing protein [Flavobacterium sp.]RZJ72575.1 MAG: RHS repeat-associated core domain-containing protein [Flavobacterium sp.]
MKKIALLLLTLPMFMFGQTVTENFVSTKIYKEETTNSISNPQPNQASQNITYMDGLGRPIQTLARKSSANGKNIVSHIEYDAFGRQIFDFLPYESQSTSLDFESSAFSGTQGFYSSFREGTTNPTAQKEFDGSPLNRILKQSAPGDPWTMGQGHETRFAYDTNLDDDYVKIFSAQATWSGQEGKYLISFSATGTSEYAQGTLYKNIVRDENWTIADDPDHSTEEYKDKEGKVVLKRTFENGDPHDTYYVYDQFGNLTYVLPPKTKLSSLSGQLDGLCYQYVFDQRNRLVEKKLPGKQWEFIVYDKLDRIVATGPTFSPFPDLPNQQGWIITKYDKFNRPILTGWIAANFIASSRSALQQQYDSDSVFSETKIGNGTPSTVYSSNARPQNGYALLSVNYYDEYDFPQAPAIPTQILSDGSQSVYYNQVTRPKGVLTGNWIRILETSIAHRAEVTSVFYDNKGRAVAEHKTNYLGGYTKTERKIDFSGKTTITEIRHKRSASASELFTKETFIYTDQDRLLSGMHQIGASGTPQLISYNAYDALGSLDYKLVGGTSATGANRLQNVNYEYNVRGWLTAINREQACDRCPPDDDLFRFEIKYQNPSNLHNDVKALYNGNISETYWKGTGSPVWRKYGYAYDGLNRLTMAHYQKVHETMPNGNYDEMISYDKNGNIETLYRKGDIDAANYPIEIDDLSYHYAPASNRLLDVGDSTADPSGFKDEGDDLTMDYDYDANGNMTKDDNKGITSIRYNHLNLPVEINFSTGYKIQYTYNSSGAKVLKKVIASGSPIEVDYLDGFQYKDAKLEFFPHAEGYVRNTLANGADNFNYVFQYKDHLGNVRMNFALNPNTQLLEVLDESHYYPFGLKHSNYSTDRKDFREEQSSVVLKLLPGNPPVGLNLPLDYNYKYNGKEWQDELGLNFYDYGARNYDPAIGRWMNIDPLAEKFTNISPFAYTANNPILYIDPDGKDIYLYYTTEGNSKKDDTMFWQAALTRARDFINSGETDSNDIFRITRVKDLASIKTDAESFIAKNSEKYGKTKEFGVWSHAGTDGPVGTAETSKNALSLMENRQMSLEGWADIKFNWAENARAFFYGCQTSVDPSGEKKGFTTEVSGLSNFKDVSVFGQTSYTYPSMYANSRRPSSNQLNGIFGKKGEPTYIVAGNRYQQPWIGWFGNKHFESFRMTESKNGQLINN